MRRNSSTTTARTTMTLDDLLAPVHETWLPVLDKQHQGLIDLLGFLNADIAQGHLLAPDPRRILRALATPVPDVRVLILGQDPYPTAGHAVGWAFATERHVSPLPASLRNIFRELRDDLGVTPPATGDLSTWVDRGVFLLNRVLTVRVGEAGSHRAQGWEEVTAGLIGHLNQHNHHFVAALWGRDAQTAEPLLAGVPTVVTAHPSPLSARRGFFGSRPFTSLNRALESRGEAPMDWSGTD